MHGRAKNCYDRAVSRDLYRLILDQAGRAEDCFKALEAFVLDPSAGSAGRFREAYIEAQACSLDVDEALSPDGSDAEERAADSEEAFRFARAIDDMTYGAKSVVEEMLRFGVVSDRFLREMSRVAREGCTETVAALKHLRSRSRSSGECVVRAKKAYRQLVRLYRQATTNVLDHPNVVEVLKTKEIYRHFYAAADRGDAAAEAIGNSLVKALILDRS